MFLSDNKALSLVLMLALWPLLTAAQIDPASLCSLREQQVFAGSFEELTSIAPIGMENCANLDRLFDADLTDANPLEVLLNVDETYQFATLATLANEYVNGDYTAFGFPGFGSFDSEFGVSSLSPGSEDVGSFLVEYNVAPGSLPGSVNPLFVEYQVGFPSTLSVSGLDFEGDGEVTSWPFHGTWADANSDGVIDQSVFVREGKGSPYEAWVLSPDKNVSLTPQSSLPSYVSLVGNRVDFHPPDGLEGDSGVLELLVCDVAVPSDCSSLSVPYEVVDRLPQIVGLSYTEQNGTIDNPVAASGFALENEVACTADNDERFVVTKHYDVDQSYQIINHPTDIMGINASTGGIGVNPSCPGDIGRVEFPSVRVVSNSGSSNFKTAWYTITNGVETQSFGKNYK